MKGPVRSNTKAFTFLCAAISPWTPEETWASLENLVRQRQIDWEKVVFHANRHELVSALYHALQTRKLLSCLPDTCRAYLEEIYRFNRVRNLALVEQLTEITQQLNDVGVTPLFLKGGAALMEDLYPDIGIRFMWDLDLLVPAEQMEIAVNALGCHGYAVPEKYQNYPGDKHHYPPLFHPDKPASVELHRRLLDKNVDLLNAEEIWRDSRKCAGNLPKELSAKVLSPTDELLYSFLHSELHHSNHYQAHIDIRQMLHFSYISIQHQEKIDWIRLEKLPKNAEIASMFNTYSGVAQQLFFVNAYVVTPKNQSISRHYQRLVMADGFMGRLERFFWLFFRNLLRAFSHENLKSVFPESNRGLFWLRLQYAWVLARRYSRSAAWLSKFGS